MPVYEYRCTAGHHYEKAEPFGAPAEQACPRCGRSSRRQISLPAVIFKGPGFYSTDNRRGRTPSGDGESAKGDGAKKDDASSTPDKPGAEKPSAGEKTEAGAV